VRGNSLKEKLIGRILEIDNEDLLAKAYRLLSLEVEGEELFKFEEARKVAIAKAMDQLRKRQRT
jgi:hypothetical protein